VLSLGGCKAYSFLYYQHHRVLMGRDQAFDSLIAALRCKEDSNSLENIAKDLKKQKVKFPKALINAIEFYSKKKDWKTNELAEFLEANRDIFERVYLSGRFLPPFGVDFSDVSGKLQEMFILMAKRAGIKNPGDYIYLSEQKRGEYGYTSTIILLIPISSSEVQLVAATVRSRRWYIPPSKAQQNLNQLVKQIKGTKKLRREMKKVENETLVLIGRYTSGVRGVFQRKGFSKSKRAVLVFDDKKRDWFVLFRSFLLNLFSKRLNKLMESLGNRKPFGEVAERIEILQAYLSFFNDQDRIRAILNAKPIR